MDSIQELRPRVEELSSDQTGLHKAQEHDNSDDEPKLDDTTDPVARLPYEISSEIFLQCLPSVHDREPEAGADHIPMLLLNICSAWTAVALSTPALWASIQIVFPRAEGFAQFLSIWFRRAAHCPMYICLRGDFSDLNHDVLDIIWKHGAQLRLLELSDDGNVRREDSSAIDLFERTTLGPLPALETFIVRNLVYSGAFRGPQILEFLRLAPNLVECDFDRIQLDNLLDAGSEKVVLPTLRRLTLNCDSQAPLSDADILSYLRLPALEFLFVPSYSRLVAPFLKDSAPPIRNLILDKLEHELMGSVQLYECLHLLPDLTQLKMYGATRNHVARLFAWLTDYSFVLPDLNNLAVISTASAFDPSWLAILRALSARRMELRIRLIEDYDEGPFKGPPADVLTACMELVKNGGQIYIGTQGRNFIVA
ncbi:hypothetical protein C8R45DRAFT_1161391 [Mycena sanguinolenta]|nr:hypothetical protein C8R45DRAFT_1161391 [Mycena sanguinolenta]